MIRVADYIVDFIYKKGVKHVFMLSGGGAMFLNDAVYCHKKIKYICNHHEQACAMAGEAYARANENFGAAMVTTGPGATNAITGVLGGWVDSTPMLVVSGQSKTSQTIANANIPELRQYGVQEADIISMVKSITKYAVIINDKDKIKYYLEKAYYLAKEGRPGPVWIDVPQDVQGALIDPEKLTGYSSESISSNNNVINKQLNQLVTLLKQAKKPLIIAGNGIRLAHAIKEFHTLIKKLNIPVTVSILGIDIFSDNHPLYLGKMGTKGIRSANIAIQNADLLISIGCRLSVASTGFEFDKFAPQAKKVVVDIDPTDHLKKTIKIDLLINSDALKFIQQLNSKIKRMKFDFNKDWPKRCKALKERYPLCLPEYKKINKGVNMYYAVDKISDYSQANDIFITDAGSTSFVTTQALKLKKGQRFIVSGGICTMGYNLPASIGAVLGSGKRVICITGDGSFQMNIHELQIITYHNLPIIIVVMNNGGYHAIKTTQTNFFKQRFIGINPQSGLTFPDMKKIAYAYGIKYYRIANNQQLSEKMPKIFKQHQPIICEIICPENQQVVPVVSSKKLKDGKMISMPLDNMYPYLGREEMDKIRLELK